MNENQILVKLEEIERMLKRQTWENKPMLGFSEACDYLGVSDSYLYKLTSQGRISFNRPTGKRIWFRKEDLEAFLAQGRRTTTEEFKRNQFSNVLKTKRSGL